MRLLAVNMSERNQGMRLILRCAFTRALRRYLAGGLALNMLAGCNLDLNSTANSTASSQVSAGIPSSINAALVVTSGNLIIKVTIDNGTAQTLEHLTVSGNQFTGDISSVPAGQHTFTLVYYIDTDAYGEVEVGTNPPVTAVVMAGANTPINLQPPNTDINSSGGCLTNLEKLIAGMNPRVPNACVAVFAGNLGGTGNADGIGAAARFSFPGGVATDSAGNVYVADNGNSTIRKVTPAGEVTTLAGTAGVTGSADGTGAAARFKYPQGVATDRADNVYVADSGNSTIRKITPAGEVTTLAGTAGVTGSADGAGASFNNPQGVATDSAGNVYVADSGNSTIRIVTPAGVVRTLAGTAGVTGSADGSGPAASFNFPSDVATDSAGNVYVADYSNYIIRKIAAGGVVTTLAGSPGVRGAANGTGSAASFNNPQGVATDSAGNVYVADYTTIRKITPAGEVTTLAGSPAVRGYADGTGPTARFDYLGGVATDSARNVYVADTDNSTIRKITPATNVTTLAGTAAAIGSIDGTGAAARFNGPAGVATDSADNVYVADTGNNTIRKITPAGEVTTVAGTADAIGSIDGIGSAARFNGPAGVATDSADNVYVADTGNNTIRKITPAGEVTTLAGTAGVTGGADGSGPAASFNFPSDVATDSAGNVYVADTGNSTIRKITPSGVVITFAGMAGAVGSDDGTGAAARFNAPSGVATDSADNVYVADTGNSTIRKITPAGVTSTIVGLPGQTGFTMGALPGVLSNPERIAVIGSSLYVTFNNGLAMVTNLP
jgi:NHL repeat